MQDRVIVVVGATGGIGSATVRQLAPEGARLVLAARNSDRLDQLRQEGQRLSPHGDEWAIACPTDVTDSMQVERLVQRSLDQFGRIDALVNAAGAGLLKPYHTTEPADLDAMLDLNLKGSFYTTQAVANVMKGQRSGHICNVVGILGKHSMAMASAYCASKFGMVGFSKCMAEELKRYGVKLTLFYFGGVDSPFWDTVSVKVDRSKMLSPEMAARSILFALSADPQAVPIEVNLQPESHLFF